MRLLAATAAVALVATASSPARAQSADAIIDRAVAAWSKVKTARGAFDQTVSNSLTGTSVSSRGTFAQERPNRLAIRFTEPGQDAIVSDGKALWIYLPSSTPDRVIKRSVTDRAAVPIDITGQFLESPHERYDASLVGSATTAGHAAKVVRLTAKKGAGAPVARATVWIDDDDSLIREFESTDANGVTRHVKLTQLELNGAVARDVFAFKAPAGVKIVDQTKEP